MVESRYRLWPLPTLCRLDSHTGHHRRRDAATVWDTRCALRPRATTYSQTL